MVFLFSFSSCSSEEDLDGVPEERVRCGYYYLGTYLGM